MKKIFFWLTLICSILVLIGSCGEKEESDDETTTTSSGATTASGSITMGSYSMSGVYKTACSTTGVSANVAAGNYASDVQSLNFWFVVTGNDNVTKETHLFTDTSCSNSSYFFANFWDNVTIGTASGSNYPVTYNITGVNIVGNTTAGLSWLEEQLAGVPNLDITLGTVFFIAQTLL